MNYQLEIAAAAVAEQADRVARFIAASVAGLGTDDKVHDWKKLLIHPSPHAFRKVGASTLSRDTPLGLTSVDWRASAEGQVSMAVTVPIRP
jgi:hypothetical protein